MTMSVLGVYDLDRTAQIFKPLRPAVCAIWSNASLAHKLTVWQKQRHESEGFLRGAEAAQRLQGCRRLHRCRLGTLPGHCPGIPGLRRPELDHPDDRSPRHSRLARRTRAGLDV